MVRHGPQMVRLVQFFLFHRALHCGPETAEKPSQLGPLSKNHFFQKFDPLGLLWGYFGALSRAPRKPNFVLLFFVAEHFFL